MRSSFWIAYALLVLAGCGGGHPAAQPSTESDSVQVQLPPPIVPPPCDGFDFPVGPPDAKGYYNAQGFGKNAHLGDDWNGRGGGNSDLGDPVYAVASGIVHEAKDYAGGWGNVVWLKHNTGTLEAPELLISLYAHLDSIWVTKGDTLSRGQQLGSIGDAHGSYLAHLHFEIRDSLELPLGGGYDLENAGYLDPTAFIRANRPGP